MDAWLYGYIDGPQLTDNDNSLSVTYQYLH